MGKETGRGGSQAATLDRTNQRVVDTDVDFEALKQQRSSTPREARSRCPNPGCESLDIKRSGIGVQSSAVDTDYYCKECGNRFDEPTGQRGLQQ